MNEPEKCFAYYVEVFNIRLDKNYIMQSKLFETMEEAENFAKSIEYLDSELRITLNGLVGDEEDYDIIEIGNFVEQLYGFDLVFTNKEYI